MDLARCRCGSTGGACDLGGGGLFGGGPQALACVCCGVEAARPQSGFGYCHCALVPVCCRGTLIPGPGDCRGRFTPVEARFKCAVGSG